MIATIKYNKYTGTTTPDVIPAIVIANNKNNTPEKILCFIVKVANNAISAISKADNLIIIIKNSIRL